MVCGEFVWVVGDLLGVCVLGVEKVVGLQVDECDDDGVVVLYQVEFDGVGDFESWEGDFCVGEWNWYFEYEEFCQSCLCVVSGGE